MANQFAVQLCELLDIPVDGVVGLTIVCGLNLTNVNIERQIRNSDGRPIIADHVFKTVRENYELVRIASLDSEWPESMLVKSSAEVDVSSIGDEYKKHVFVPDHGNG